MCGCDGISLPLLSASSCIPKTGGWKSVGLDTLVYLVLRDIRKVLDALRKRAYSNTENFTTKKLKKILIVSSGYSQSLFLSRNKNNNVYPV